MLLAEQKRIILMVQAATDLRRAANRNEAAHSKTAAIAVIEGWPRYADLANSLTAIFGVNGPLAVKRLITSDMGMYGWGRMAGARAQLDDDLITAGYVPAAIDRTVEISVAMVELTTALAASDAKWKDIETHVYLFGARLSEATSDDDIIVAIRFFTTALT